MMWRFCGTGLPTNSALSGLKPANTSVEWLRQLVLVPPSQPLLEEKFWSGWNRDYGCRDSQKVSVWIDGIVGNLTSLQSLMPWGLNESGWALFSLGVGCTLVLLNFSHLTKYLSVDTTVMSCCLFILFSFFFFLIFKLLLCAWVLCTGCSHTYLTERMQLAVVLLGCRRTWTCTWPHIFFQEGLTEPNPGAHQGE